MQAYRVRIVITKSETLTLTDLPFRAGDEVEVIIHKRATQSQAPNRYPLRGEQVRYIDPFESVAEHDWAALR